MTDEVLAKQKKAKEIRDRIEKLKHLSDDHAVEARQALEEELAVLGDVMTEESEVKNDDKHESPTTTPITMDRISAKEYRKVFVKYLLSCVCWNALPVLLIVLPLLLADSWSRSLSAPRLNIDAIIITVFIGWIWLIVANIILFFREGLKGIKAWKQRINDLGWNGEAIVFLSILFAILCFFASKIARVTNPSLAIVIYLPCLLWLTIFQGLSLFKKGQPTPNKYGLPINDDNPTQKKGELLSKLHNLLKSHKQELFALSLLVVVFLVVRLFNWLPSQMAKWELEEQGIMPNNYGHALHVACAKNDVKTVSLLITADADVNTNDKDGRTPLHEASEEGHTETVKLLIEKGADVNKADEYGETPLHRASLYDHTEIVKLLIAKGADVNKADMDGRTPLFWASRYGHTEIVKLLIAAGADVNKANKYGHTPLCWASRYGHTEIVKLLIAAGADVNKADMDGETPLHGASEEGHTEIVKLLIEKGAEVNKADKYGRTPLDEAASKGHTEVVKLLIEKGADVNKADEYGETPLFWATKNGHTEIVELLRAAGAKK